MHYALWQGPFHIYWASGHGSHVPMLTGTDAWHSSQDWRVTPEVIFNPNPISNIPKSCHRVFNNSASGIVPALVDWPSRLMFLTLTLTLWMSTYWCSMFSHIGAPNVMFVKPKSNVSPGIWTPASLPKVKCFNHKATEPLMKTCALILSFYLTAYWSLNLISILQ